MTVEDKSRISIYVAIAASVIAIVAIGLLIHLSTRTPDKPTEVETIWQIEREVFVDTIPYFKPVPKDSLVVRYETVKLPTTNPKDDVFPDTVLMASRDSVEVEIPITQKQYQADEYRAYVSGYEPRLDSIFVYPRTEVVTVTETTTLTEKAKQKRWGLGIQAGYGYGPKGFQPYVGLGISWNVLNF